MGLITASVFRSHRSAAVLVAGGGAVAGEGCVVVGLTIASVFRSHRLAAQGPAVQRLLPALVAGVCAIAGGTVGL